MWFHFFKHIDVHPKNVHILDGNAKNLDEECENYEKKIVEAGGIDLFIGGECNNKSHLFDKYTITAMISLVNSRYRSGWSYCL